MLEIEADLMYVVGKISEDAAEEYFEVLIHVRIANPAKHLTLPLSTNYFCKKVPSYIFDRVLNASLLYNKKSQALVLKTILSKENCYCMKVANEILLNTI